MKRGRSADDDDQGRWVACLAVVACLERHGRDGIEKRLCELRWILVDSDVATYPTHILVPVTKVDMASRVRGTQPHPVLGRHKRRQKMRYGVIPRDEAFMKRIVEVLGRNGEYLGDARVWMDVRDGGGGEGRAGVVGRSQIWLEFVARTL